LKKSDEKSVLRKNGVPIGFIIISIDKKQVFTPSDVTQILTSTKGGILLEGINPDGSKGYYGFAINEK
jgi:hypothetical protein